VREKKGVEGVLFKKSKRNMETKEERVNALEFASGSRGRQGWNSTNHREKDG